MIHILAPGGDLLALPLALAEVDAGEVGRRVGGLAVGRDGDFLCGQRVLRSNGPETKGEKSDLRQNGRRRRRRRRWPLVSRVSAANDCWSCVPFVLTEGCK